MVGKTQRQHRIGVLLEHNAVSTQEQLVELLSKDGVEATQATVSRDLEELGAIKVRVAGGEPVYALPELPSKQVAPTVAGDDTVLVVASEDVGGRELADRLREVAGFEEGL